MPREHIQTVYKFDELSGSAKEKAREWYRDGALDYAWWDSCYEDFERVGEILGITFDRKKPHSPAIWFQGFYTQGSGSAFDGSYSYAKQAPKKIWEYAGQDTELHRIADALQALQKRHFYRLTASIEGIGDNYISVDVARSDDTDFSCATIPEEQDLVDLLKDFNHWMFKQLQAEYEYLTSDEAVDESIRANEYEFTEDGKII